MNHRHDLRTLAIIAHVDHGKTTLVDALFRQGGLFREGQEVDERLLDSIDQERERGITILAKATSVRFGQTTLQIVDTPGHSDFGGEVERTLRMVDGVLLLVDAAEGPQPQTRFVLRKALEIGLPAVTAINKIDRADARAGEVLDEIYDLFIELGANESQLDFPVLYTNAKTGTASLDPAREAQDLRLLVEAIQMRVPPPEDLAHRPFLMQVNQLTYDTYVGRLVVGRIREGRIRQNQQIRIAGERTHEARVTGVYVFMGIERHALEEARAGDIVALAGIERVGIGDTLTEPDATTVLDPIHIDEPTVSMTFQVNDGPLGGTSGATFLTSRHLAARLRRESYANVSIQVKSTAATDQFRVRGRGELQLAVLIESMRREGYELCVRNPEVVTRDGPSGREEPVERLVVDVAVEHLGPLCELIGRRRGRLESQEQQGGRARLEYTLPTRGLFGLRSHALTATRGTAVMHSVFEGWTPWTGPLIRRSAGALVADRAGLATPYALFHLQPRGVLFISPGEEVYEGMIVGEHSRGNDLNVNVCREKKLTNIRAAGRDDNVDVTPARRMSLELCLEWVRDDEMVEVTPDAIRLRKAALSPHERSVLARR